MGTRRRTRLAKRLLTPILAPIVFSVGLVGLMTTTCTPFGSGADSNGSDATTSVGGDGAATTETTEAGDASASKDGQLPGVSNCSDAFFCETFNDNALETRSWVRIGSVVIAATDFVSPPYSLLSPVTGGSTAPAFIARHVVPLTTPINRVRITLSMKVTSGTKGDMDFVAWKERGSALSGVFITRSPESYMLSSYDAFTNRPINLTLTTTFGEMTRFTFLLDFGERTARYISLSEEHVVPFPANASLTPDLAELDIGISHILKAAPDIYVARYDDLVVEVE